jgi:hypothetical protein
MMLLTHEPRSMSDHREPGIGAGASDAHAPRAIRRTDRQMSDERAREVLARGYAGRLGTVGRDGWPYVVPLLYVWRDGEIWLHTAAVRGHLRDNIDHEPRVCSRSTSPARSSPTGASSATPRSSIAAWWPSAASESSRIAR